jgi:uncharacterized protein YutE (UPF0331/DUF86 family)
MVKKELLLSRFEKLDDYLCILEKMKRYSEQEFIEEPERYGSAERFLQLAIEVLNDIGNHIISDLNLGKVNWYSDIPRILHENKTLSDKTKECWIKMIGCRNIIVHDYVKLDRSLIYNVIQNNLSDFTKIKKCLAQYL